MKQLHTLHHYSTNKQAFHGDANGASQDDRNEQWERAISLVVIINLVFLIWFLWLPYGTGRHRIEQKDTNSSVLVGVVGGMGPRTHAHLVQLIFQLDENHCRQHRMNDTLQATFASADACHTPFLLYSNPQTPNNNLAVLGHEQSSKHALQESCRALKGAGATVVAFACTAAHTWLDELDCGVPVLDLVSLTGQQVARDGTLSSVS